MINFLCPECKKEIDFQPKRPALECTNCKLQFEKINGVLKFTAKAQYADSFSTEWTHFRKTQLDSYTGTRISEGLFFEYTGWQPSDLKGKRVLDVGCGTGRYLEVVLKEEPESLVGVDLSEAVYVAAENLLLKNNRLMLLQCDANHLPLPDQVFDFVYSIGVIHHTPDPYKTWKNLVRLVKPGGRFAIWVYGKGRGNRLPSWIPRPIYLYQFLSNRIIPSGTMLKIVLSYVPWAIKLNRQPLIGRITRQLFPAIDYKGRFPLSDEMLIEWACLDTFDCLTPKYARTYTVDEIIGWYKNNGFCDIKVGKHLVSVSGKKLLT